MAKHYYCRFGSPSTEFNDVNLQLYSLRKAADCWNELVYSIKTGGGGDLQKEKQVFIMNCLGLSLTQLLGQNGPYCGYPKDQLEDLLDNHEIGADTKCSIKDMFREFNKYYNAGRHFGKEKYNKIDQLTVKQLDEFRLMTIKIWDIVCGLFDETGTNHSVADVIIFDKLP